MSRNLFLAIAALAIAVVPVSAGAQPAPGVIAGVIRDGSGAPVPGAVVRVVNERTGSVAVVVSDEHGAYRSGALTAGAVPAGDRTRGVRSGRSQGGARAGRDLGD